MGQKTTEEFSYRFNIAVEGHPNAPPTPHGRQRWVLKKLETEAGLGVSPNTVSKWFNGKARPRADHVRQIAQVLSVDEVWLSMGRKPVQTLAPEQGAERARGAVMVIAGLVEIAGGRVTFAGKDQAPVDLQINLDGEQFDVIVVALVEQDKTVSCVVPEPAGDARVLTVVQETNKTDECLRSACIDIYDLTDAERQSLGGFSVMQLERRPNGKFKAPGLKKLLAPVASVGGIVPVS